MAIEDARHILGEHIALGPRDATETVHRLIAVLDRDEVVHALDRMKRRRTLRPPDLRQILSRLRASHARRLRQRARRGRISTQRSRDFRCDGLGQWCQRLADAVRGRVERLRRCRAASRWLRYKATITLDLRNLGKVVEVDPISRAALIEGGAYGPSLENQLKPYGVTLRHFPQSFEYSTLGGWIATRSGGHFASLYTHIDDLVESLRVVTQRGIVETRRLTGMGAGLNPDP